MPNSVCLLIFIKATASPNGDMGSWLMDFSIQFMPSPTCFSNSAKVQTHLVPQAPDFLNSALRSHFYGHTLNPAQFAVAPKFSFPLHCTYFLASLRLPSSPLISHFSFSLLALYYGLLQVSFLWILMAIHLNEIFFRISLFLTMEIFKHMKAEKMV